VTSAQSRTNILATTDRPRRPAGVLRHHEEAAMLEPAVAVQDFRRAARADPTPCVFVVDADVGVRESLAVLLGAAGWRPLLFASASEALSHPPLSAPSCLVLDVGLPHCNGLDLQQRFAVERVTTPIVFMSALADVPTTVRAMKGGAVEFLTKPVREEVLLPAVEHALALSRAAVEREAALQSLRDRHASLTRREQQVLACVVAGRLNKQIAGDLDISEITVKAHRGKMMRKMAARSVPELVKMAARLGIAG
jgi:FixJ family two-component response regulator